MDIPPARDGPRVLLVEDEYLIGCCLAEELEVLGFEVEGPFATCAEASAWLVSHTPETAVLDILLRDGDCLRVARELRDRQVPILFVTGLHDWPPLRTEFVGAPVIQKPAVLRNLDVAVGGLLGRGIRTTLPAS